MLSSPRVQAAAARVEQARAVLGFNEAGRYPTLEFSPDASRSEVSGNRPDQPSKVPGNTRLHGKSVPDADLRII